MKRLALLAVLLVSCGPEVDTIQCVDLTVATGAGGDSPVEIVDAGTCDGTGGAE